MTFIGIISDCKSFETIKEYLKNTLKLNCNLIYINKNSIENVKNIRFETIIIDSELSKLKQEKIILENLFKYAKYIIINTDINLKFEELNISKANIITYGLNSKAMVTVSSITDTNILVYLQKELKDCNGKSIEVGEQSIKITENKKLKIYEILIIYIVFLMNNKPIIHQTQEKSNFFEEN